MNARRDVIRKMMSGLIGGSMMGSLGCTKQSDQKVSEPIAAPVNKNWRQDPQWYQTRYGDWGGPGVSSKPGPMDEILLKDYAPRSLVVAQETFIAKAKYPVIDSHVHVLAKTPEEIEEWVRTKDEVGIAKSVVLTGATGERFEELAALYAQYSDRFILFCGIDKTGIGQPDYTDRAVAELVRCHEMGARGVGEVSDKGYGITGDEGLSPEERLHPDDIRLDAFWEKCGELRIPVNLHVADHPSCWTPLDVYQERSPDYQHFNKFDKNVPSHEELIAKRNRTLDKHPDTIFVACHLGNQGHDLNWLSGDMDRYPNLYLDTSARDYELGRTPRASYRFLNKYKDRVVFGTDQGRLKSMYQMHWRLYQSADEYFVGRVGWRYYGLELPDATLSALYKNTARQVLGI